jgi:hypothetical protein
MPPDVTTALKTLSVKRGSVVITLGLGVVLTSGVITDMAAYCYLTLLFVEIAGKTKVN